MAQTTKNSVQEGRKVKPQETVTVYATDKAPFNETGKPMEVHSVLADKLVEAGKATREAPKETKTAKSEGNA